MHRFQSWPNRVMLSIFTTLVYIIAQSVRSRRDDEKGLCGVFCLAVLHRIFAASWDEDGH